MLPVDGGGAEMQALKEVALRLLNVYVSPYVENLNAHDLSVSVFGGKSIGIQEERNELSQPR